MPFQLTENTKVTVTNANPRREFHGDEKVRAIDIAMSLTGENTLLDLIEPGLRAHHYCNNAKDAGQQALPNVDDPLPNLRFPALPDSYTYTLPGKRLRGYRWVWDFGTDGDHVDFSDAVLAGIKYEVKEGGSVTISFTVSYNGDELQDNVLYGELSGLASTGEIWIKLLAPEAIAIASKGYRAGRPDTPAASDDDGAQGQLVDDDEDDLEPYTPEQALADAVAEEGTAAEGRAAKRLSAAKKAAKKKPLAKSIARSSRKAKAH